MSITLASPTDYFMKLDKPKSNVVGDFVDEGKGYCCNVERKRCEERSAEPWLNHRRESVALSPITSTLGLTHPKKKSFFPCFHVFF